MTTAAQSFLQIILFGILLGFLLILASSHVTIAVIGAYLLGNINEFFMKTGR